MTKDDEIASLKKRIAELEGENKLLQAKIELLTTAPALARGLQGEILVAQLTEGVRTGYGDPHDVTIRTGDCLEVKNSHLNAPGHSRLRRWNWYSPLGYRNKGKEYNFLVLVGEKDMRYAEQYPADLPYVFFLVPRSEVETIMTQTSAGHGTASIALNTNLKTARAKQSVILKTYLVRSTAEFIDILRSASSLSGRGNHA